MSRYIKLLVLLCVSFLPLTSWGQSKAQSIFDLLAGSEGGRGTIRVVQSSRIRLLVGRRPNVFMSTSPTEATTKVRGYRIQIYSGNRPNSKAVAQNRELRLKELHPDFDTYINYQAPFWKLRAGNYLTSEAAREALQELKREFPAFAREMYIVRDVVLVSP